MQRRRLLAGLGAGLAVGLAGCGDDADDGPPDVDWLDDGALDAETLAETHADALVDAGSFTLFSTAETDYEGEEQPSRWLPSQEYEAGFSVDPRRQYLRQEDLEGEASVSEAYVADGEAFYREVDGDQEAFHRETVDQSDEAFERTYREDALAGVRGLDGWNMTFVETVDDGETLRLTADAFDGDADVPDEVDTAEATLSVTTDGVVRELVQHWEGAQEGIPAESTITIEFRDVGETPVDEPDWVAEAREETDGE